MNLIRSHIQAYMQRHGKSGRWIEKKAGLCNGTISRILVHGARIKDPGFYRLDAVVHFPDECHDEHLYAMRDLGEETTGNYRKSLDVVITEFIHNPPIASRAWA